MRRLFKWVGITLGALVGLVVVAFLVLTVVGGARLRRTRVVEAEAVPIPTDSAALARGQHVVHYVCTGCHGPDLTGTPIFQSGALGAIYAANITGLDRMRSNVELVREIRHAVAPDGRDLVIMPAESMIYLSKQDLGAVIAYLRTVPRTGDARPRPRFTLLGKALIGAGMFGSIFPAARIDHATPFPPMPDIGANYATGEYLSRLCYGCHGTGLGGGTSPDPDAPPVPSLAGLKAWPESAFIAFSQTGRTPAGRQINPKYMPWDFFGKLDPDELRGLYVYLHTRP
jgi:mono/diheme cytochrome c family protein